MSEREQPLALAPGAIYSVGSLARVGNVSTDRLRRLLRANGIELLRVGRVLAVSLVDLRTKLPSLWDSLVLMEQLRSGVYPNLRHDKCAARVRASRAR
jgi:hypothetical protein